MTINESSPHEGEGCRTQNDQITDSEPAGASRKPVEIIDGDRDMNAIYEFGLREARPVNPDDAERQTEDTENEQS